ncbi:MAG: hypothetical protein IJV95_01100 [Clostridia bacterium]|nr:hypothetical protein [Clostridia bacterium]
MVNVGDIVLSKNGRSKGKYFLVVTIEKDRAYITDGRSVKVTALKKKNIKHLESVETAVLKDIAVLIEKGVAVGNQRVYRSIHSKLQKKQED